MNSNRMLVFILLALVVVFVGVGGWLYLSNNSEITKQNNLKNQIVLDKKILTQDETANAAQQKQSVILQSEVAAAQTTLAQINFPTAAQTVDDDRVLYSIAANTGLQITSLTATPAADNTENGTNYQITTFTLNVAGLIPQKVFASAADSVSYDHSVVNEILAFPQAVVANSAFSSGMLPSVSLTSPVPMTDSDIATLNTTINNEVQAALPAAQTQGLTPDQIAALVKTTLAAMTPTQVQALIEQAGFTGPTATFTIQVWTIKGE
jgi:hypothetical protein